MVGMVPSCFVFKHVLKQFMQIDWHHDVLMSRFLLQNISLVLESLQVLERIASKGCGENAIPKCKKVVELGVSKNRGKTPKSSILNRFSIIKTIHFGCFPPIFGNIQLTNLWFL